MNSPDVAIVPDIHPDAEIPYKALRRAIQRGVGFSLLFVRCTPVMGEEIIKHIEIDLPQKRIEVLNLDANTENLYNLVKIRTEELGFDVLFIRGLEESLFQYEDREQLGILERSKGTGYGGNWESIPRILGHLNLSRERFRDDFKLCFVFLLPEFALNYFIRRAPDFFDWRSNVYEFPTERELLIRESYHLTNLDGSYREYCEQLPEQLIAKLAKIKSYLEEELDPEERSRLWNEKGLIHAAANQNEEALAACDKALEIKPDYRKAWYGRGVALDNLDRYEEAIASFDRALEIKPDYYYAWKNREEVLVKLEISQKILRRGLAESHPHVMQTGREGVKADLITQLCKITAEILKANPQGDLAELVELAKKSIDANSQLGEAIQSDHQLTQINLDGSKGFQTWVAGGVANIGNTYLNDVKPEMVREILQRVLADMLKSQPQVMQTAFENVTVGGNLTANIDQSVNKTVINYIHGADSSKAIPSNVRQGSPNFVGREDELAEIYAKLQEGQNVIVSAVMGMGGVGKTELALQYAHRYHQEYVARYWLSLREMGLAQAVVTLASPYLALPETMQSASLDEQAAWYWQNWLPQEGKVLVILDDVTDLKSIPKQARPLSKRFQILVTTRKRKLSPQFAEISLGVISELEALELLKKLLGAARVEKELAAAKAICEYLGYLPLGVELAGKYLQLDEYLRLSDHFQRLIIADESLDLQEGIGINCTRGVIAAFELSWQELSSNASKVAMMLGLFAPADIAWSLVEEVAPQLNFDAKDLQEGRKQLNNFHLIKAIDEESARFAIHSLMREFLQWKLSQEPETNRLFREAFTTSLLAIAKEIPSQPTQDLIARVAPAIPHLDMLSREMLADIPNPEEDNNLAWVFTGIARFYEGQGLYALAEDPCQRCLKAMQELFGDRHPSVANSINNLAGLYVSQGRYEEAEPLYKQALAMLQELLGDRHPSVANSINNLADLYRSQGRYEEAEPLYKQALALGQELLGDRHPYVATSLNNLAGLYVSQGRYEEGESLYKQALAMLQELLGDRHPYVATSLNNLAGLYESQGRYEEAEPLLKQALSLRQELLGDRHPYVASSLNNLAVLYRSQGRYEEAEPLYKQALSLSQELLGNRHPDVATSINNLALLYYSQGRYEEAEPLYKQALSLRHELLGDRHPDVATSINNLALLYSSQGRYEEAEPLYKQALSLRQELLGDRHPYVASSLNNLAELYHSQGRYEEAEPFYVKALEILEVSLGMEHPNTKTVRDNLQSLRDLPN